MAFSWLRNGGDPNYLLTGRILQVDDPPVFIGVGQPFWRVEAPKLEEKQVVETAAAKKNEGHFMEEINCGYFFSHEKWECFE